MSTLGRFFDFQVSPIPEHRIDKFKIGGTALAQGAPVKRTATSRDDLDGRVEIAKAAAGAAPTVGDCGIAICELPWPNVTQTIAPITRASDFVDIPADSPIQVVHGTEVEFVLRNISADALALDDQATYAARNMILASDLASMELGKTLTPGAGNDTDGYWKVTATAAEVWARVVDFEVVDDDQAYVVAQLTF